jgi:hypothetical protein
VNDDDRADADRADDELSRRLTATVRAVPGVVDVFDARPVLEAAVEALAARLVDDEHRDLVLVERREGRLTVTAHVATDLAASTPEVLARTATDLRTAVADAHAVGPATDVAVTVRAQLVEPGPSGGAAG